MHNKKSRLKEVLSLIRAQYFVTSLLPMMLVIAEVLHKYGFQQQMPARMAAVSLIILLLHTAANLVNDYYDLMKGCDTSDDKPGKYTPATIKKIFTGCYLLLIFPTGWLIYDTGWLSLLLVLLGVLGSFIYTATDWSLKYHALGEFANLFFLGPAIFLSVEYALVQSVSLQVLGLSLIMGFLITTILSTNNLRDIHKDSSAGIATIATLFGYHAQAYLLLMEIILAFLVLVVFILRDIFPLTMAVILVWLPVYLYHWFNICRTPATTVQVMIMVQLYTLSGLSLLTAILLKIII